MARRFGAHSRGVGRLGQMRLDPGALQLLDHEPPAGAALDRERRRRARPGEQMLQPAAQQHPVGRSDSSVPGLAAALVEVVKGDLPPVDVEPAYDPHRDLLKLHHSRRTQAALS
ncbi:hypothetical protein [Geodermatophilus sp. URMC 64]